MTAFKPAFKSMVAYTPAFIGAPYQLALRFSGRAKVGPDVMRHCHTGRKLTLNNRAHAALSQKAASLDTVEGVRWDTEGSCLLYTSPSPRDGLLSRMPSSA